MVEAYFKRFGLRPQLLKSEVPENLSICIVMPAYAEGDISDALSSLIQCEIPESIQAEIIVVVNAEEIHNKKTAELNSKTQQSINQLKNQSLPIHLILEQNLPSKKAGVGLARKIGMDEATRRLFESNSHLKIIACFDADSLCTSNYLTQLYSFFKHNENKQACSIYFEHPIDSNDFDEQIIEGILFYEMHLRYYKNALKFANSPYAFHTIGSSMAVSANGYIQQGGMNQRKAGEDFYFLQKFMKVSRLGELNDCKIIPSPRASNRVPFGTGRAIQEHLDAKRDVKETYSLQSFILLKKLLNSLRELYDSNKFTNSMLVFIGFIGENEFEINLVRIKKETNSFEDFENRFHQWLDAFKTLKFIHHLRENHFPNNNLMEEANKLLGLDSSDPKVLLEALRELDRT